ncbi:MAG: DNA-3-methyladenine glycosylase I [Balneolaceae bacterium]
MTDKSNRCSWCLGFPEYIHYHDTEWGVPSYNDLHQFEMLILEGAQAGLSWATVLKKREGYREAFERFDPEKIARYGSEKIESLLQNPAIIRNRLKVESTVSNAQAFLKIVESGRDFSDYMWQFTDGKPLVNHFQSLSELPAKTEQSDRMSKQLKKDGFKFVGSTICYAHMQATGMVNDHLIGCFRYEEVLH